MIHSIIKVTFSAPICTTEEPEKVKAAVSNLVNYGKPKSEEIQPTFISNENQDKESNKQNEDSSNPFVSGAENVKQTAAVAGDLKLLSGIHYLIRKEEIIDTANTAFVEGVNECECSTTVYLNKQAAFMKHLSFPADIEPLGSIELKIEAETPEELQNIIDWLTPPTKDGVPLFELKINELQNSKTSIRESKWNF